MGETMKLYLAMTWLLQQKHKLQKNKLDVIKIKYFCTSKDTINRVKRQPKEWKNIYKTLIKN